MTALADKSARRWRGRTYNQMPSSGRLDRSLAPELEDISLLRYISSHFKVYFMVFDLRETSLFFLVILVILVVFLFPFFVFFVVLAQTFIVKGFLILVIIEVAS